MPNHRARHKALVEILQGMRPLAPYAWRHHYIGYYVNGRYNIKKHDASLLINYSHVTPHDIASVREHACKSVHARAYAFACGHDSIPHLTPDEMQQIDAAYMLLFG